MPYPPAIEACSNKDFVLRLIEPTGGHDREEEDCRPFSTNPNCDVIVPRRHVPCVLNPWDTGPHIVSKHRLFSGQNKIIQSCGETRNTHHISFASHSKHDTSHVLGHQIWYRENRMKNVPIPSHSPRWGQTLEACHGTQLVQVFMACACAHWACMRLPPGMYEMVYAREELKLFRPQGLPILSQKAYVGGFHGCRLRSTKWWNVTRARPAGFSHIDFLSSGNDVPRRKSGNKLTKRGTFPTNGGLVMAFFPLRFSRAYLAFIDKIATVGRRVPSLQWFQRWRLTSLQI